MNFSKQLNEYINKLDCSANNISRLSGVSSSTMSRYRSGERVPDINNKNVELIAKALAEISMEKNIAGVAKETILSDFEKCLKKTNINMHTFALKFNTVIDSLDINASKLAKYMNFDSSYISKIRTEKRMPSDMEDFVNKIVEFILEQCKKNKDYYEIVKLMASISEDENNNIKEKLVSWFFNDEITADSEISKFLSKLDDFDLGEYIKAINFDSIKLPTRAFMPRFKKNYYGIEEIKKCEINFIKATVISKSKNDVFMFSDMEMADMAKDIDFSKKWMFGLAMALKKGLHFNVIHNVNRPFSEMMLGLESWIPLYMTGQITPYYIQKDNAQGVFCHLNYVSGAVAVCGECISGYHGEAKYYLTQSQTEINYYKKKSEFLLTKASPLMQIYNNESKSLFNKFLMLDSKTTGDRKNILVAPPVYTMTERLLNSILRHNNVTENERREVLKIVDDRKQMYNHILETNNVTDEITLVSKEEFEHAPISLSLSFGFSENAIFYNYEQYKEHFELTKRYAENNSNYECRILQKKVFSNIEICICHGKNCVISKTNSPTIQFVIKHPKLLDAIENMKLPIV